METTVRTYISVSHICKTAILITNGMISFFFLMKLLNLDTMVELRFFNFIFIFFGVRHVLLHKRAIDNGKIEFHTAMMMGFLTVFFSSALFSSFVFIYLNLDSSFMHLLKYTQPFGAYLTPASSAMATFLEGVASGAIVAIPVLRTMKKRVRTQLTEEHISQLAN